MNQRLVKEECCVNQVQRKSFSKKKILTRPNKEFSFNSQFKFCQYKKPYSEYIQNKLFQVFLFEKLFSKYMTEKRYLKKVLNFLKALVNKASILIFLFSSSKMLRHQLSQFTYYYKSICIQRSYLCPAFTILN